VAAARPRDGGPRCITQALNGPQASHRVLLALPGVAVSELRDLDAGPFEAQFEVVPLQPQKIFGTDPERPAADVTSPGSRFMVISFL
jgi:hypothetical protein